MTDTPARPPAVSRRTALAGLGAGGLSLALASTPGTAAQDATPPHPLVGAWLVASPGDPSRTLGLNTFGADGTALFTPEDGRAFHGVWESTGPRTAALTVVGLAFDPFDPAVRIGIVTVRGSVEVDDAGQGFHANSEDHLTAPDGTVTAGLSNAVVGTRITVQPMGTPDSATPAS